MLFERYRRGPSCLWCRNRMICLFALILVTFSYIVIYGDRVWRSLRSTTVSNNDYLSKGDINMSDIERKRNVFTVSITDEERNRFKTLIEIFDKIAPPNVTYLIYSGTLLGSYRYDGMIPWDDDLDILVRDEDKFALEDLLSSLDDYDLYTRSHSWKLFHTASQETRYGWKWPFLDMFFYLENETCIWDSQPSWSYKKYLKKDIFPLTRRLFMGLMLPAPRNTTKILSELYDMDVCETNMYNHKEEKFVNTSSIVRLPCKELWDKFPFVQR